MSWGYDQTNVNFFQVTSLTKKGVHVREIGKTREGATGPMSENVLPVKDAFLTTSQWCGKGYEDHNPETFHKLKGSTNEPAFTVKGRYYASKWNGKPCYSSWYH